MNEQNNQDDLTPEQIKNWRKAFEREYGPAAATMSDESIIQIRENMQAWIDALFGDGKK